MRKYGYPWASRFCVAMCAYYHTGTACFAADFEDKEFWAYLRRIYDTAPRASERRHFRGQAGRDSLASMEKLCNDPSMWFDVFPRTYEGVAKVCQSKLYQFGPYFQLKVCDYIGCLGTTIKSWTGLENNLPTEPARALQIMFPDSHQPGKFLELVKSVQGLGIMAPPWFDRDVGPSEVETSLCGWKTTKFKGNWFGADIKDKREALKGYTGKAPEFADMMPPVPSKTAFTLNL